MLVLLPLLHFLLLVIVLVLVLVHVLLLLLFLDSAILLLSCYSFRHSRSESECVLFSNFIALFVVVLIISDSVAVIDVSTCWNFPCSCCFYGFLLHQNE